MKIEIDQSGKIEQTHMDTVIALSNDTHLSVLIPRKSKRSLQSYFRAKRKIYIFPYVVFSIATAKLLSLYTLRNQVYIDIEYYGHEALISKIIRHCLDEWGHRSVRTQFTKVGKTSPAHEIAAQVMNRKKKADCILHANDILAVLYDTKIDREVGINPV